VENRVALPANCTCFNVPLGLHNSGALDFFHGERLARRSGERDAQSM
jgi:hypothetical protein